MQNFANCFAGTLWSDRFPEQDDSVEFIPGPGDLYLSRRRHLIDNHDPNVASLILSGWEMGWLSDRPGWRITSVSNLPFEPVIVMRFPDEVTRFAFVLQSDDLWELFEPHDQCPIDLSKSPEEELVN